MTKPVTAHVTEVMVRLFRLLNMAVLLQGPLCPQPRDQYRLRSCGRQSYTDQAEVVADAVEEPGETNGSFLTGSVATASWGACCQV